jgi:energy-coupling factor transport system permease protein
MKDSFSGFHPIVNFIYFCAVILFSMFFMHPIFLVISLISSFLYSIRLNGRKALRFNLIGMLPLLLLTAIVNPIFNHAGVTILLYINDNPLTLESILYGIAAGAMFVSVIVWFSCYNAVMTSDKFIYLFGRIIPALSLILSMVLRFVPRYKAQVRSISHAQKCIGRDVSNGNLLERVHHGIKILSILVTWALENAIETADSMKARGYGLKGRTSFSLYRFDRRDTTALTILSGLILVLIMGAVLGENNIQYFPAISAGSIGPFSIFIYLCYALLCLFPVILDVLEDLKWRRLRSKI